MAAVQHHDVGIIGGGLAGLCLARQLKLARPKTSVLVLERHRFPVPEAMHTVGESVPELGSHYLMDMVGISEHLERAQPRSRGCATTTRATAMRTWPSVSRSVRPPSYPRARPSSIAAGLRTSSLPTSVNSASRSARECGAGSRPWRAGGARFPPRVHTDGGEEIACRWLIDASGRPGLIKRKLGLGRKVDHDCNAVWFRVGRKMDLQEWSTDEEWKGRLAEPELRWRATNH